MIAGLDLSEIVEFMASRGRGPDELADMTPYGFAAAHLVPARTEASVLEMGPTAAAVAEWNRRYRTLKGLKPMAPEWFLRHLRAKVRRERQTGT